MVLACRRNTSVSLFGAKRHSSIRLSSPHSFSSSTTRGVPIQRGTTHTNPSGRNRGCTYFYG